MKAKVIVLILISLVFSMFSGVFAADGATDDILDGLDRRDQDVVPEIIDLQTDITIQEAILNLNEEGIPIVRVRLRPGTTLQTATFSGINGGCVEVRSADTGELLGTTAANQAFTVKTMLTGVRIEELNINAGGVKLIPVGSDARINIAWPGTNSRNYRGTIEVAKFPESDYLIIINELSIEDYICGVVPNEMPASWPAEALKAQAVSARTYSLANMNKHSKLGYNLCDSSACCQAYLTNSPEHTNSTSAVRATAGQIATYQGKLITTFYSSSTGGYTESYFNWGSFTNPANQTQNPPHLQAVADPYDLNDANARGTWIRNYTLADLTSRFSGRGIGEVTGLEATKPLTESGRQMEITVYGTSGQITISGQSKIRSDFGFWSAKFTIVPKLAFRGLYDKLWDAAEFLPTVKTGSEVTVTSIENMHVIGANGIAVLGNAPVVTGYVDRPTEYEFIGGGWGHGVGMSQYGAYGMAIAGKTHEEIIKHYYTGIEIEIAY